MDKTEVLEYFSGIMKNERDTSVGIAAIRTLLKCLDEDGSETVQELYERLKSAIEVMRNTDQPITALTSGSELFLRFIALAALDREPFAECKRIMLLRGKLFLNKLEESRRKVAKSAAPFITDGTRVLTLSKSRGVLEAMREAARAGRRFTVFVARSAPDNRGEELSRELAALGVPCTVVLDTAIGYVMEAVDMVMVGAEGVMESGGVINRLGTFTMAVCAKEMKKPFYVLTESFKFARCFPLNQKDLPPEFKYPASALAGDLETLHPLVDYTPPGFITLLFTDLGILTPSAVSDELIKLYL